MQKGFAPIYLILVSIVLTALIGAYYLGKLSVKPANNNPKSCTEELKICPDGSSVGRTGQDCEFAICPMTKDIKIVTLAPTPDITSCNSDSDCGVNTCNCTAQRQDSLGKNMRALACVGEPKCINNRCILVKDSIEGRFCGGFAGKPCPDGYNCRMDGNYPDAGGKCTKE